MILYLFIGLIIGIGIMIPFVIKRRRDDKKYTEEIIGQEKILETINTNLSLRQQELNETRDEYNTCKEQLNIEKSLIMSLRAQQDEIRNNISAEKELAKQSVDEIYQIAYQHMAEAIDRDSEQMNQMIEQSRQSYEEEYLKILSDYTIKFSNSTQQLKEQLEDIETVLETERNKARAAREANMREEEKKNADSKYRLTISPNDLLEIKRIKDIIPFMRNARPISKIIWESYFRQATNDMITRTVGSGAHIGIYRLTNTIDGRSYVGQSVDIGERFKQHIKCGLGIDAPNNNLYKAMQKDGVENFSFELLEECTRAELNNREIYWIDFYKTQEFGYNMSRGGA